MPIGRIGQEFIVNTAATGDQFLPIVTALTGGRFVVTWYSTDPGDGSGSCIRARLYKADGAPFGPDFLVNSTAVGNQVFPAATALANGRFVVTWTSLHLGDGSGSCIQARLYNADGSAVGSDFIVNTTATSDQFNPAVTTLADGRFVVTWKSADRGDSSLSCIRARLYSADGTAAGNDFIVNTTATNDQFDPAVTTLSDGRFVVTWQSGDLGDGDITCIRARLYNADGGAAGNDFIVNTTTTNNQSAPAVTALAGGRFVVTWQSNDTDDDSGTCIRGRIYNANGTTVSNDFIVNTTATNDQLVPTVTALADGRFVVTWFSFDPGDGSGACIRARLYNADGGAAGSDFIVNTTTTNDQLVPTATALADGRFVVTWFSFDPGDGSGACIRAQVFDPTVFVGTTGQDTWQGGNLGDTINGGAGNDTLSGLGGSDTISGGIGDDMLSGGNGNDVLDGGTGNDSYVVDNALDTIVEAAGQGADNLRTSVSYVLRAGVSVETLQTTNAGGTAAIKLTGNELANTLVGNVGANVLSGGGGADRMQGGAGNDTYFVDNALDRIVEGGGSSDRLLASVSYALGVGVQVEILSTDRYTGTTAINLVGNNLNQTIAGNAGVNVFNGAGGIDTASYAGASAGVTVNLALTTAQNTGGAGLDTLISIENLLGSNFADTLTGNAGANRIEAGAGLDKVNGAGGNDMLVAGSGAGNDSYDGGADIDTIVFTSATQTVTVNLSAASNQAIGAETGTDQIVRVENVIGGRGNDRITGNIAANRLDGRAGNDILDGRAGIDTLLGGLGDDWYYVDNAGDRVIEAAGGGSDRVLSSISYVLAAGTAVETLATTNAAATTLINLTGNAYANTLQGNAGANVFNGLAGADTMQGLAGSDIYVVDNASDKAIEAASAGTDRVDSAVTFTLGANVENLTLTGVAAIRGAGNTLANIIIGNSANNTLSGGKGVDSLRGGLGNDSYIVDHVSDQVVESAGAGTDRIVSFVSEVLALNVENLTLSGTAAINGIGNTLNNVITGNAANNILSGSSGIDALNGGTGNDILIGGAGKDAMTGSAGADDFDFNSIAEIGNGATRDIIRDFVHLTDDIDLSTIDANGGAIGNTAFSFLAAHGAAFTGAAGQLRWFRQDLAGTANDRTIVEGDINGNKVADFQIQLTGLKTLTAADFVL